MGFKEGDSGKKGHDVCLVPSPKSTLYLTPGLPTIPIKIDDPMHNRRADFYITPYSVLTFIVFTLPVYVWVFK